MLIPLANSDLFAEVDDEFAGIVLARRWCLMFDKRLNRYTYVYTSPPDGGPGVLFMHVFLFGRPPCGMVTDHIDGNKLNNKRSNLRHCAPHQNSWNVPAHADNTSGFKGVSYERLGGGYRRWRATVVAQGVRHRKYFDTAEQADAWARAKREELHGDFARHA